MYQVSSVGFALFLWERHLGASQKGNESAREISDSIRSIGDTNVESGRVIAQGRTIIGSLLEQFAIHRVEVAVQQFVNLKTKSKSKTGRRMHQSSHECGFDLGLIGRWFASEHFKYWPRQGSAQVSHIRLNGRRVRSWTVLVVEVNQTSVVKNAVEKSEKPKMIWRLSNMGFNCLRISKWLIVVGENNAWHLLVGFDKWLETDWGQGSSCAVGELQVQWPRLFIHQIRKLLDLRDSLHEYATLS